MIISKCPLRVSLVGGGTDLQEFIDENGYGSVVSFPCNLYTYINLFCDKNGMNAINGKYVINYTRKEEVDSRNEIKNDVARVCLQHFNLPPCQISFHSDISSYGSGLAASSAYVINTIHAIKEYFKIKLPYSEVCSLALSLERKFNPRTGAQDIYGCGLGGFKKLTFYKDGRVKATMFHETFIDEFDKYLIHTGVTRSSTKILESIDIKKLKSTLPLVDDFEKAIKSRDSEAFFSIIKEGWVKKKESSPLVISDTGIEEIDRSLSSCKRVKAYKLCGAGGGGYFLIFTEKGFDVSSELPDLEKNCFKINIDSRGVRSKMV